MLIEVFSSTVFGVSRVKKSFFVRAFYKLQEARRRITFFANSTIQEGLRVVYGDLKSHGADRQQRKQNVWPGDCVVDPFSAHNS